MTTAFQAPAEHTHGHTPRVSIWQNFPKYTDRTLTKRAVVWIGQTCNLRCYFCYFLNRITDPHHPEHDFLSMDKLKKMFYTLRHDYGCTSIDIQGGEPTIYPQMLELVKYCREIGLIPTIITNAQVLGKPGLAEKYREAGLYDFLISMHGVGESHDTAVCRKGAWKKLEAAMERLVEAKMPFRFNCVVTSSTAPTVPEVARMAIKYNARAVNYLNYNSFEDQTMENRMQQNVMNFANLKPIMTEACDMLEEAGIECNLRYWPICQVEERHRKNVYDWQQLPYDHHEWDLESWLWTDMKPQREKEGPVAPVVHMGKGAWYFNRNFREPHEPWFLKGGLGAAYAAVQRAVAKVAKGRRGKEEMIRQDAHYRANALLGYMKDESCAKCNAQHICDGFQRGYVRFFGSHEARPITEGEMIADPTHYIRHQKKCLEQEKILEIEKAIHANIEKTYVPKPVLEAEAPAA